MIAVYTRVSTKDQRTDSQIPDLKLWLESNAADSKVEWFEDHDQSSQRLVRPAFTAMQRRIVRDTVDAVVVWKLDRIARNIKDGVLTICDWLNRDVRVVSVTQPIDLSGPTGVMVAALFFGIAESEYKDRAERQAAGIAVAKERGVYRGRKKGTTKARPERAKELSRIGLEHAEIATILGVSERTVFRYLNDAE